MKIETIPIEQLQASEQNPRKDLQPGDRAYAEIERSIARWDAVEPLVWNRRSGHLVAGHQRLKVLKARGDTEVVCSVVDLSPEDELALNIALNKTGGTWDDRKLFEALTALDDAGVDVGLTGFDVSYLADLAKGLDGDAQLFAPVQPGPAPIESVAVTPRQVESAAQRIYQRFEQTSRVVDVMCPHCGQTFGWQPQTS